MLRKLRSRQLDDQPRDAPPSNGIDLDGRWTAFQSDDQGDLLWGASLEQRGTAVSGWLQSKFAAAHPIRIRGTVLGHRLVANLWRPLEDGMGSGIIDMAIESDGRRLVGSGRWRSAGNGTEERFEFRWQRAMTETVDQRTVAG